MSFGETKVYFDGSHYIAIPHTTRPSKKRYKIKEETINVVENVIENEAKHDALIEGENSPENLNEENDGQILKEEKIVETKPKIERKLTKKELFNELYLKYLSLKKRERRNAIIKDISLYFKSKEHCENYVDINLQRKQRNLICRRVRMIRKANLVDFNYFVTFTYDDKLHTEESFKSKIRTCFRHLCERKCWRYMGVWERAPDTKRLHFHGLFLIPKDKMIGCLEECSDFNLKTHRMQKTIQNTYFNERFGRSDFKEIINQRDLLKEISYIMKYLEKTEEKIVYSKGLYQYFISDIMDEDIVSTIGVEDRKLLLYDDFTCWDEGEKMGKVCPEVISQMRKCN